MIHVTDELELYALGALPATDRGRIAAHVGECATCRAQAEALEEVAIALPETLSPQEVPARLRARILASARAEERAPVVKRGTAWTTWLVPGRIAIAGLAAAVFVLAAVDVSLLRQRDAAMTERNEYADLALRASHGGKNWYMFGVDSWAGAGGTLYAPGKPDASAYVVFHDLQPIENSRVYALWLVDADGRWVRAASFMPNGQVTQAVVLDTNVDAFYQCALTIETSREGKRAGPLVMQSRIAPPSQ